MNPLFEQLNQQTSNPLSHLLSQFQAFQQTFHGDAKQQVENLMRSGKMSQEQFAEYSRLADQLRGMLK